MMTRSTIYRLGSFSGLAMLVLFLAACGSSADDAVSGRAAPSERALSARNSASSDSGMLHEAFGDPARTDFRARTENSGQRDMVQLEADDIWQRLAPGEELWIIDRSGLAAADEEAPGRGCLYGRRNADENVVLPLKETRVRAGISGHIATVDVTQVFANPFDTKIEAVYVFPLPHDAAVSEFVMTVGERRIRGVIRSREQAQKIYEQARARGLVAALLSQERPNIFRQEVANIEPGRRIEIEMRYFNALPWRDGGFEFEFPTVVGPRYNPPGWADPVTAVPRGTIGDDRGTTIPYLAPGERSGHRIDIQVDIDSAVPIRSLRSPSHGVDVKKVGPRRATVVLAPNDRRPDRDFRLRWELAGDRPEAGLVLHDGPEGRFFSFLMVPPRELEQTRREPIELVFVVDCSGSMSGRPLEKAKQAMRRALRACRPEDRFQIIRFSSHASQLGSRSLAATPANIRRGLDYLDHLSSGGGTAMIEGIRAALDIRQERGMRRVVSFMTDGFIGNEAEIFQAIHRRMSDDVRVFSFGIGNSVNRHLIEGMARVGRGAVAYVGLTDDSTTAVDRFYDRVRRPVLASPRVSWAGARVDDVYPRQLPDLFHGRPVMVVGRVSGELPREVVVEGRSGGERTRLVVPVHRAWHQHQGVSRIWARTRIADLEYEAATRRRDTRSEVEALALEFGVVSSRTSFLAVDTS